MREERPILSPSVFKGGASFSNPLTLIRTDLADVGRAGAFDAGGFEGFSKVDDNVHRAKAYAQGGDKPQGSSKTQPSLRSARISTRLGATPQIALASGPGVT